MPETYLSPSAEQIEKLRALDPEGPIVMLNLLRFKADGGRERYLEYGAQAAPFIAGAGAKVNYLGDVVCTVIGGEEWDEIILVEYPSLRAFFEMTGNPDYPSDVRSDALEDSRLVCTQAP